MPHGHSVFIAVKLQKISLDFTSFTKLKIINKI